MEHHTIEYFDGSQKLVSELIYDKEKYNSRAYSPILIFPAVEGRNHFIIEYAKKLAHHGYAAVAVDMYGDAKVGKNLEDSFKLIAPFLQNRELVRRRAVLAYKEVSKLNFINKNKIGAMGFCFGGMCVLELARSGEQLTAGISVHGILKKSDLPTAKKITTQLLVLQGFLDPQAPPESLSKFAQEMIEAGSPNWIFTFFSDAKHSFTDPNAGKSDPQREKEMGREYNPLAAERAYRFALDFFNETI